MNCCIVLGWMFWLDKREDEGAVSDRLVNRRSMRWDDWWRRSAK